MDDPYDVGRCVRCARWQLRRHAYVEVFGPGDKEEWCVTGGCFATWADGVAVVLRAHHDGDDGQCACATCRAARGDEPESALVEWAADHGFAGALDELDVPVAPATRARSSGARVATAGQPGIVSPPTGASTSPV